MAINTKKSCPKAALMAASSGGLRYRNHTGVKTAGHILPVFANKANPGVYILTAKGAKVQAVGKRTTVGTTGGVNTLVKSRAVHNQHCFIGSTCYAYTTVVCPAKVKYTACAAVNYRCQHIGQVATAYQSIGIPDAVHRVSARNGVFKCVANCAVKAGFAHGKIAKADLYQPADGLYKPYHQCKLKLLLQLRLCGFKIAATGFTTHVVNAFPVTTNYVAYFSRKSSQDSLTDCSHDICFYGFKNSGNGFKTGPPRLTNNIKLQQAVATKQFAVQQSTGLHQLITCWFYLYFTRQYCTVLHSLAPCIKCKQAVAKLPLRWYVYVPAALPLRVRGKQQRIWYEHGTKQIRTKPIANKCIKTGVKCPAVKHHYMPLPSHTGRQHKP